MGKSSLEIILEKELTDRQLDRIIEMAWEDRTPFEAIEFQFGLPEKDVIKLMRGNLKESSFKRWRKRVNSGVSAKHLKKRNQDITRFKCSRQRAISGNKISKR
ncbi:TIGR03643 family protein [Lutibacter flavus]|uniref:TIGR03643 family protein n=1 Tax=Lutibacter flavus TaxID=691689 RepID=A0A238VLV1_9FLAO|nr:TIGR03643 family protein [Lutibacter flavus]SNR35362.1 TIGR03643 family protein [Lutibacter flavus]